MSEPSWQEFYDIYKAALESRRPHVVVVEGGVYDCIGVGVASVACAIVAYGAQRYRSAFLDGAVASDLTDLAYDRGVEREPGAEAVGAATFARVSASVGAGTLFAGTRIATFPDDAGGFVALTLDTDVVFGAADLGPFTANCTAENIGVEGNIAADSLGRFLGNVFDPSITITNSVLFAGGAPEESDEDLRDRVRGFFLTQARGTIAALYFGVRQVAGVDRVSISVDDAGVVTIYIADAEGNSNSALIAAAQLEIEQWRDAADIVYITGGLISLFAISIDISVRTGTDLNSLLTAIRQAVVSRVARLNPGEELSRDIVESAVRAVDPEKIVKVSMVTPAATIVPALNESIRTAINLITFNAPTPPA